MLNIEGNLARNLRSITLRKCFIAENASAHPYPVALRLVNRKGAAVYKMLCPPRFSHRVCDSVIISMKKRLQLPLTPQGFIGNSTSLLILWRSAMRALQAVSVYSCKCSVAFTLKLCYLFGKRSSSPREAYNTVLEKFNKTLHKNWTRLPHQVMLNGYLTLVLCNSTPAQSAI